MPTIYQISTEPIEQDAMLTDDGVVDSWFYDQIADRVYDENDNRFERYAALAELLTGRYGEHAGLVQLERDEEGNMVSFTVSEGYPAAYFAKPYELFKTKLDQLTAEVTFEAFLNPGMASDVTALKSYVDDKYGDYVYENDEYSTMDRFIRYIEPGIKYYIGGVVFYK